MPRSIAMRRGGFARRRLDVVTLPSPGRITDEDGDIIPASYMNFYIGNAAVVVPQYGAPNDRAAVEVVQALFPGSRRSRPSRRPHPDRRRKLPLHFSAGAGLTPLILSSG